MAWQTGLPQSSILGLKETGLANHADDGTSFDSGDTSAKFSFPWNNAQ